MARKNRYVAILIDIFENRYTPGDTEVRFVRQDLADTAKKLGIPVPKNLGDVLYSLRYRTPMPEEISDTAPEGLNWIITSVGRGMYAFNLVPTSARILPTPDRVLVKIPDATPEIISANSLGDEQALLVSVRYNRLVDLFLKLNAYSLQNHLRTTVTNVGQIEIDEVYLGIDRQGAQYVIPVQAKGGNDEIGIVQIQQDLAWCAERYPNFQARSVACQFIDRNTVVMFELGIQDGRLVVLSEEHYRLAAGADITPEDLALYRRNSQHGSL